MSETDTPILPAHIEGTVEAIARMHAEHRDEAKLFQKIVERATAQIARPSFLALLTAAAAAWVATNMIGISLGRASWDPPPFNWLQGALTLLGLYVALLILTTQRRDDQLAAYREQLTLELAILGEQKSAKIIALLEEMRRDSPFLRNRADDEAKAMSVAADPQEVLDAIKGSQDATRDEPNQDPNPEDNGNST